MRIKEVLKVIGKERKKEFLKFIRGQTVGVYPDGALNYYTQDVHNFLQQPNRDLDSVGFGEG